VLTYGIRDQKVKVVVEKGSTLEVDGCGTSRGSRGAGASWSTAPRPPGVPQAASGSRGGVDVAPSVDSAFSSPPTFFSSDVQRYGWGWDP
jgi:hypothetical protein